MIFLPRHTYFRTKPFNTMYLHPKEDGKQNLSCEKLLDSEVSPLDLTNMLNFLKSGRDEVLGCVKPIEIESAAQDVCWPRIAQEQLTCNEDGKCPIKVDFEASSICFRVIESLRCFSDS